MVNFEIESQWASLIITKSGFKQVTSHQKAICYRSAKIIYIESNLIELFQPFQTSQGVNMHMTFHIRCHANTAQQSETILGKISNQSRTNMQSFIKQLWSTWTNQSKNKMLKPSENNVKIITTETKQVMANMDSNNRDTMTVISIQNNDANNSIKSVSGSVPTTNVTTT